jgi:hypothetical protein
VDLMKYCTSSMTCVRNFLSIFAIPRISELIWILRRTYVFRYRSQLRELLHGLSIPFRCFEWWQRIQIRLLRSLDDMSYIHFSK